MKRVYVAGPYTQGDVAVNVRTAAEAGLAIIKAGHAPYIPHLSHFLHYLEPQPYQTWMQVDLAWIDICDALLRLEGSSPGADTEVEYALSKGISVFSSLSVLLLHLRMNK